MAKLRKLQILIFLPQKTPFQSLCTLASYKTTYFRLFFHLSVKNFKKMLWKWSKRGESVGGPLFIQHPAYHIQGVQSHLRSVIHITCKSASLQIKDLRTLMGHPACSNYLNNHYFNFHVYLSFRMFVRSSHSSISPIW